MAEEDYSIDEEVDPMDQTAATMEIIRRMREEESMLPAALPTQPAQPVPPSIPSGFTQADFPLGMPTQMPAPFVRSVQIGRPQEVPMTAAVEGPVDMRALLLMQQYEGRQGYQSHIRKAVAQGKDPQQAQSEALAIFGPSMFASPSGRGLIESQRLQNIAGVGYSWNPFTGTATPRTPERPKFRSTPQDDIRKAMLKSRLDVLDKREINAKAATLGATTPEDLAGINRELNGIRREREAVEREYSTIPAAPISTPTTGFTNAPPQRIAAPTPAAPVAAPIPTTAARRRRGGPKEKLARAEELRQQYPDASRAEILDMVKSEFD